jgi:flavin-binding protein dodecin
MSHHVYKQIELTGTSPDSLEDAIQTAVTRAGKTLRNLRWFNVTDIRGYIEGGQVAHWQVSLKLGFTLDELDTTDETDTTFLGQS